MRVPALSRRRLLTGAALCASAWPSLADATVQRRPWPAGQATPPLALPLLDGGTWTLAGARGKVVAINFWASWCEPCRAEMPSLELMAARHEADGLVVVAVNFKESEATMRRFRDQTLLTVPLLRDADGAAAKAWQVRIFPSTLLVGRDGRARFAVVGEADWSAAPARQWVSGLL